MNAAVGVAGDLGGMVHDDVADGHHRQPAGLLNWGVEGASREAVKLLPGGTAILMLAIGAVGYANYE